MDYQKIQTIITIITGLGLFAGSMAFVIDKFFTRQKTDKGEEINSADTLTKFWKDQAEQYKVVLGEKETAYLLKIEKITTDFNEKFQDLKERFGNLKGQYEAEKSQRERVESILKDRNPETEAFMKLMIQAIKDQSDSHTEMVKILKEIHTMSKAEHDRDFKVETTVTKS